MDVLCNVAIALADCVEINIANVLESGTFNIFQHALICQTHGNLLRYIEKYTERRQLELLEWVKCTL